MTNGNRRLFTKSARMPFLLCGMILSLLMLSSCGGETTIPAPTATGTITPTPCPTNISRPAYPAEPPPILIYVLVEGTERYAPLLTPTFDILADVLEAKVEPGDKLIVSFMEYERDVATILHSNVEAVDFPSYAYSPLSIPTVPTYTPVPTNEGSLGSFAKTPTVVAAQTQYSEVMTKVANEQYCSQVEEEAQNKSYFEEWSKNRTESIEQFMANYSHVVTELDLTDLPVNTNPIRALGQSTGLFDLFCDSGAYQKCYLIVFSNLISITTTSPTDDNVNLDGINVIPVLQECTYLSDCSRTIERWTAYFTAAGASSVTFIPKGNESESIISQIAR
jgi:hypothetical protein